MYELKIEDRGSYLCVTVRGELNPTTDMEIDAEIRKECEKRETALVSIDIRPMKTRLTGIDNHIAATSLRQRMGPSIRAIAIIDAIDFDDKSEMYELTATNRGAAVKFFTDGEAAESWLLGHIR